MRKNLLALTVLLSFIIVGCGSSKKEEVKMNKDAPSNEYIVKGMDHLRKQEVAKAIQNFDLAIKNDPSNSDNYVVLGQVYLRLKNYTRAVDTLKAATSVEPDNGEAFYLLATSSALKSEKEMSLNEIEEAELSRLIAIKSAKKSMEIFMDQRNEEHFKRSITLLQSLTQNPALQ